MTNRESLQEAVDVIKHKAEHDGNIISDEEIAQSVSISKDQLDKYLNGGEDIPDGFLSGFLSFYKIKFMKVSQTVTTRIFIPDDDNIPPTITEL